MDENRRSTGRGILSSSSILNARQNLVTPSTMSLITPQNSKFRQSYFSTSLQRTVDVNRTNQENLNDREKSRLSVMLLKTPSHNLSQIPKPRKSVFQFTNDLWLASQNKNQRVLVPRGQQNRMNAEILEYLQRKNFQKYTGNNLQLSSYRIFLSVFEFLYTQLDNRHPALKKSDEEFIKILKLLRFPHVITQADLQQHSNFKVWPRILSSLHWMMELAKYIASFNFELALYGICGSEEDNINEILKFRWECIFQTFHAKCTGQSLEGLENEIEETLKSFEFDGNRWEEALELENHVKSMEEEDALCSKKKKDLEDADSVLTSQKNHLEQTSSHIEELRLHILELEQKEKELTELLCSEESSNKELEKKVSNLQCQIENQPLSSKETLMIRREIKETVVKIEQIEDHRSELEEKKVSLLKSSNLNKEKIQSSIRILNEKVMKIVLESGSNDFFSSMNINFADLFHSDCTVMNQKLAEFQVNLRSMEDHLAEKWRGGDMQQLQVKQKINHLKLNIDQIKDQLFNVSQELRNLESECCLLEEVRSEKDPKHRESQAIILSLKKDSMRMRDNIRKLELNLSENEESLEAERSRAQKNFTDVHYNLSVLTETMSQISYKLQRKMKDTEETLKSQLADLRALCAFT